MITLQLGNSTYTMPTKWAELYPDTGNKFVPLCQVLSNFEEGRIDFEQMRILAVFALLGIKADRLELDKGNLNENIYRLLPFVDFLYTVTNNRASICPVLYEQIIPKIGNFTGYRFSLQGGVAIDCDITAEQYVDAVSLTQAFSRTSDRKILSRLAATLYCPHPYDPQAASAMDMAISEGEMLAVYYNFRGILEWVRSLPAYDLIFRKADADEEPAAVAESPLGMAGSIFAIAKAGYGDIDSIRKLDMFTYLGILVQMTMDSIRSLAATKMKPIEIAERLHLHIDQVLSVTSQNC